MSKKNKKRKGCFEWKEDLICAVYIGDIKPEVDGKVYFHDNGRGTSETVTETMNFVAGKDLTERLNEILRGYKYALKPSVWNRLLLDGLRGENGGVPSTVGGAMAAAMGGLSIWDGKVKSADKDVTDAISNDIENIPPPPTFFAPMPAMAEGQTHWTDGNGNEVKVQERKTSNPTKGKDYVWNGKELKEVRSATK